MKEYVYLLDLASMEIFKAYRSLLQYFYTPGDSHLIRVLKVKRFL